MGNEGSNSVVQQPEQNQQLIQGSSFDVSLLVEQPNIKKVFAIKNPLILRKETLKLQRDSEDPTKYYIEFHYDSLCDFDLYINYGVTRRKQQKEETLNNTYVTAYVPSDEFAEKGIVVENLPKGQNMEFIDKKAVLDLPHFLEMKKNEENYFDVAIEMVPTTNTAKNEVIFVTLCKIVTEENEAHNHKIKVEMQKLKAQTVWIDLYDVFNCALDSGECLICCSSLRNTIFLPCKHSCTCNSCAHSLRMRNNPCPICKNQIDDLLILETEEEKKADQTSLSTENTQ